MNQKYTDEELLDKLKSLLEDKGTLNYSIVENEPNFPSRHAFQEHCGNFFFGSRLCRKAFWEQE